MNARAADDLAITLSPPFFARQSRACAHLAASPAPNATENLLEEHNSFETASQTLAQP